MGVADELAELSRLHADGFLTPDEFARAKAQLLGTPQGAPELNSAPAEGNTRRTHEPTERRDTLEASPQKSEPSGGGDQAVPVATPTETTQTLPYDPDGMFRLGRWTRGAAYVAAAAYGLAALLVVAAFSKFTAYMADEATAAETLAADDTYYGAVSAALLASLVFGVLLLLWMWRFWAQVSAATGHRPRRGRGWAIGGWITPIAMLWIPKQTLDDFWRLTAADDEHRAVTPMLHWWWALWLGGVLLHNVAQAALSGESAEWNLWYGLSLAGAIAGAVSLTLLALSIDEMTRRLDAVTAPAAAT